MAGSQWQHQDSSALRWPTLGGLVPSLWLLGALQAAEEPPAVSPHTPSPALLGGVRRALLLPALCRASKPFPSGWCTVGWLSVSVFSGFPDSSPVNVSLHPHERGHSVRIVSQATDDCVTD